MNQNVKDLIGTSLFHRKEYWVNGRVWFIQGKVHYTSWWYFKTVFLFSSNGSNWKEMKDNKYCDNCGEKVW